jgi:hypothetical protein
MNLSPLENDLLGDLAQDDHSLYEMFEFVRLHHPALEDQGVLAMGRALVSSWVERNWLELAGDGAMWGSARTVTDLVPIIDRLGQDVLHYFVGSPWLRSRRKHTQMLSGSDLSANTPLQLTNAPSIVNAV